MLSAGEESKICSSIALLELPQSVRLDGQSCLEGAFVLAPAYPSIILTALASNPVNGCTT